MTGDVAAPKGWRQSMSWIHTWLGLLAGWILFAMFLTGTASYFRPEITRWMQPELHDQQVSPRRAAETAIAHMQATSPTDQQWYIYLPDERSATTRIFAIPDPKAPPKAPVGEIQLDPATGAPIKARETLGGEHFYRFHFQLQLPYPWGRWLAGVCAIFMLAAIISGVITHKRFFADFFTLRWNKGQRSWLDAHNASAVLALPFHAMITYTGLITLVVMYMPWPIVANYKQPTAFYTEAYGGEAEGERTGKVTPLKPIGPMIRAASREWVGGNPGVVVVRNPNDSSAIVTVQRRSGDSINARGGSITYSGASGQRLSASSPPGPALSTAGVMLGLHIGQYAGPVLRWTYFILGLIGTTMVGTGLLLWTAKRRKPGVPPFFGFRLVERLNIGAIACLPAGMAAFLIANRILPADMAGRADLEVAAMFWTWFGLALLSLLRPVRRAWPEMLSFSALCFLALPIINMMTTDRGLPVSIARGDWLFLSFDMAFVATGALLGFGALRASKQKLAPATRRRRVSPTVPPVTIRQEIADAI